MDGLGKLLVTAGCMVRKKCTAVVPTTSNNNEWSLGGPGHCKSLEGEAGVRGASEDACVSRSDLSWVWPGLAGVKLLSLHLPTPAEHCESRAVPASQRISQAQHPYCTATARHSTRAANGQGTPAGTHNGS